MYQEKIKNYKQSYKNEFDLGFNSQRLAYIPDYFSSYLKRWMLPSCTLLVSRDNQSVHLSSRGVASVNGRTELNHDAIYRNFSMTEPVTSAAIMMV